MDVVSYGVVKLGDNFRGGTCEYSIWLNERARDRAKLKLHGSPAGSKLVRLH
jgi:hypothetical protein